jgi:hypothetical protein
MPAKQGPAVVVGSLEEARLAAAFAGRVLIVAAPIFGWAVVEALQEMAGTEVAYDPGERAGFAADALQRGAKAVIFPSAHPQHAALAALAAACGARLLPPPAAPLVLTLEKEPVAALARLVRASGARP